MAHREIIGMNNTLIPEIAHAPIESWVLTYDLLGWSLRASHDAHVAQFISPTVANLVIGMIRRAVDNCAIGGGLQQVDIRYADYQDQQALLEIERDADDYGAEYEFNYRPE